MWQAVDNVGTSRYYLFLPNFFGFNPSNPASATDAKVLEAVNFINSHPVSKVATPQEKLTLVD